MPSDCALAERPIAVAANPLATLECPAAIVFVLEAAASVPRASPCSPLAVVEFPSANALSADALVE